MTTVVQHSFDLASEINKLKPQSPLFVGWQRSYAFTSAHTHFRLKLCEKHYTTLRQTVLALCAHVAISAQALRKALYDLASDCGFVAFAL